MKTQKISEMTNILTGIDGLDKLFYDKGLKLKSKETTALSITIIGNSGTSKALFGMQLLLGIYSCLLYTSDAADDMQCVDLGGRRIIKKKKKCNRYTKTQPVPELQLHLYTNVPHATHTNGATT
eukprot:TRINITY_DN14445_c0_g1_i1.p2 TRINITY_DN14445_c0_g1~~TRINITY_DN14445_c0_g1_i1.p2  ORF type:complete len:124 (-),score=17.99 TRINITY_DN14445_c0_g1_i1:7-378(-)